MNKEKLVYEIDWLVEYIYRESDKLIHKITNTTIFEDRCIKDIGNYLAMDEKNRRNKNYLIRLVKRKVQEAENGFKKEESDLLSDYTYIDDDGDERELEPTDVLADVESEVIAKTTIDLLAKGDRRKKEILGYWAIGNTNYAEISRLLAQSLGGNSEAHRKAINRFREDCCEQLDSLYAAI